MVHLYRKFTQATVPRSHFLQHTKCQSNRLGRAANDPLVFISTEKAPTMAFSWHPQMDLRDRLPAASSGTILLLSLGYQRQKWPKLKLILTFSNILVCCCCSGWPGLPELPQRRRPKEHSPSFRALPANKTSSPRVGADWKHLLVLSQLRHYYTKTLRHLRQLRHYYTN